MLTRLTNNNGCFREAVRLQHHPISTISFRQKLTLRWTWTKRWAPRCWHLLQSEWLPMPRWRVDQTWSKSSTVERIYLNASYGKTPAMYRSRGLRKEWPFPSFVSCQVERYAYITHDVFTILHFFQMSTRALLIFPGIDMVSDRYWSLGRLSMLMRTKWQWMMP